jgi:Protein of unknown function (DUF1360)
VSFLVLVVLVLATYRLARAVAQDDITEGARQWVLNHQWTWTYRLISCTHCCGFWLAFAVTGVWYWATDWPGTTEYLILSLAVAGGQSAMATVSHRFDTMS